MRRVSPHLIPPILTEPEAEPRMPPLPRMHTHRDANDVMRHERGHEAHEGLSPEQREEEVGDVDSCMWVKRNEEKVH